jgi:hypothetical protein
MENTNNAALIDCTGGIRGTRYCPFCGQDHLAPIVRNLTPHDVNIVRGNGSIYTIPKEGPAPRLGEKVEDAGSVDGIPVVKKTMDREGCDLPQADHEVYLIVSLAIAQAFPERRDLLVPDGLVRNEQGAIIGCSRLARIS